MVKSEKIVTKTVLALKMDEQGKTIVIVETPSREMANTALIEAATEKTKAQTILILEIKRGLTINNEILRMGGGWNTANYCDCVDSLSSLLNKLNDMK